MLLDGQVAVITGAASARGIGRAIARLFVEHGARVALLDRDGDGAAAAAAELGREHSGYACDVTSQEQVAAAFAALVTELGPPAVLVNNAGITSPLRLGEVTRADYDAVMDVNVRGSFLCAQAIAPLLRARGGGSIVCMSSVSAKRGGGIFGASVYSAAKAGVLGLTRALARELAPDQIRVNAVAPGLVDTDIFGGKLSEERRAELVQSIPLGRIAQPLDVARACLFLASDLAAYITGEVLDVNGGSHID
ncbi:MAG TPA: SDR family NAD(P)-dependent oxidoreductase [Chloroflexaceae bacterium]|nr:SDR family NAD(P)-dependent oxidoreductase [Chloroflexaceae bacterium]